MTAKSSSISTERLKILIAAVGKHSQCEQTQQGPARAARLVGGILALTRCVTGSHCQSVSLFSCTWLTGTGQRAISVEATTTFRTGLPPCLICVTDRSIPDRTRYSSLGLFLSCSRFPCLTQAYSSFRVHCEVPSAPRAPVLCPGAK